MNSINSLSKILVLLSVIVPGMALTCKASYVDPANYGSPKGAVCVTCHRETSPGIYNQWQMSAHGQAGVNCYDCHRAQQDDPDVLDHKELISIIVTPKDCARCHEKEYKEFSSSHHADAVAVLASFDNYFGRVAWGSDRQYTGCNFCHGSTIEVLEKGALSPATWPNTGIGRINPDKSKGSCSACHAGHQFSIEQARRPETCGRCHTGSTQPQFEVYTRSKHGAMYAANRDRMNMENLVWRAGEDYSQAPTCATCHMSAIPVQMEVKTADERIRAALNSVLSKDQELLTALLPPTEPTHINYGTSHDVSSRLSLTLATEVSAKRKGWQENRQLMQSVCVQCHGAPFVKQHYVQLDDLVATYNNNFALPAGRMVTDLQKENVLSKPNYDDKLELIYWEIWNEGGHAARSGSAMGSPDYLWTEGMQQIARKYRMEFIPEIKNILGRKAEGFLQDHKYVQPSDGK